MPRVLCLPLLGDLVRAVQQHLRNTVVHRREGEHELGGAGIVVAAALPQADECLRLGAQVVEQLAQRASRLLDDGEGHALIRVRGRGRVWGMGRGCVRG